MENRSKKLIKNTIILTIGTICTKGILFIMTPLFARWITQSSYGLFDLIITYISLLFPLITLGICEGLFRFLAGTEEKNKKKVINSSLLISIIGLIIGGILILIISLLYKPIQPFALLFYGLLLVETVYNFLTMTLRGFKQLTIYTKSNIIYVFSMAILSTVFIKIFHMDLNGVFFGYICGYIISITYMILKSRLYKNISLKSIDAKLMIKMIKYSVPMIPNSISWWVMDASDRTIVSVFLGTSTSAILSVTHKIPNLCQTIFSVFHLSWQENAIETINDKDREEYYNKIMNNMIKTLMALSCIIISLNFLYFKLLFSKEYFSGYFQTPILMVSIIFSMLSSFIGGIYIANFKSYKNGITTTIAAIINIIIHLLLIKKIGLFAATISTLVSYIVLFSIRYIDIRRDFDIKISKNNILLFLVLIYFCLCQYINNNILNSINLFISIILFLIINKEIIVNVMKKLKGFSLLYINKQ